MKGYELPKKFTEEERAAYKWLHDCKIRGFLVDMKTKKVITIGRYFKNLIEFARFHGMPIKTLEVKE